MHFSRKHKEKNQQVHVTGRNFKSFICAEETTHLNEDENKKLIPCF